MAFFHLAGILKNLGLKMNNYLYNIFLVGIIGSYISYCGQDKKGFKTLINRLIEGIFCGFISYEIMFYNVNDSHLSLAICGFGAWAGTNIFNEIKEIFFKYKKDNN